MATRYLKPIEDAALKSMAHILGGSSAAALALDAVTRRRAAGEDVMAYHGTEGRWQGIVVGPRLTPPGDPQ